MNLNITSATRIGLNVLALLGATLALYLGHSIFIPLVFAALLAGSSSATAQVKPLAVGTMAPDFKLPAATSAGV